MMMIPNPGPPVLTAAAPAPISNTDNLKDKILSILGGDDPVIMAFSRLSMDDVKTTIDRLIRESVQDKSKEVRKHALKQIYLTLQEVTVNPARVKMILSILAAAVQDNVLSGREACECLKELLNTDIESFSMELLNFFDTLIGCTDHKICQEIFTICLQEISKLPSVLTGSHHRVASRIKCMFTKILDRTNLVMPPICSYSDIMVAYSKPNSYAHWSVSELFNNYVGTFNCLIDLLTKENTEFYRPVIRHSFHTITGWKLDQTALTFHTVNPGHFILHFSGPYSRPQTELMLYTLKQPSSRDFIHHTMLMLRAGKGTICPMMEEVFMKLVKSTASMNEDHDLNRMKIWERLGGELTSLIFTNAVNIRNFAEALLKDLKVTAPAVYPSLHKHRDFLMWTLHRCFSFCLKVLRVPKKEFLFIGEIIKLLYPEQNPLPIPDLSSPLSVIYLSAATMWAALATRSSDNPGLQENVPQALITQLHYIHGPNPQMQYQFSLSDFSVCVYLNHMNNFVQAFSNSAEAYSLPLRFLVENIAKSQQTTVLPGNVQVVAALTPIPMEILDMLTTHAKFNFFVTLSNHIYRTADPSDQMNQSTMAPNLAPALLETFARLLSYAEMDVNSFKIFMNLITNISNLHNFSVLCSLMETFVYRLQFTKQTMHRMNMLTQFQSLSGLFQQRAGNQPQMLYMLESFTIKILMLLNHQDHTKISSNNSGVKILSTGCEELNKLFILTVARNSVVSGNKMSQNAWLKPFMDHMIAHTPAVREWSPYTLAYFPPCLLSYCNHSEQAVAYPSKNLSGMVNDELNKIQQVGMKSDLAKFYKESDHNEIFLCILLKTVLDSDNMPNYALKVTHNWTPSALKNQIRNMIDFILVELKNNKGQGSTAIFNKIAATLNDFVFRYHIMPFDTLILILSLRKYSDQDANISFYLIHNLLINQMQLRSRVEAFVGRASPDFWRTGDWCHVRTAYHNQFPEHQYWNKADNYADRNVGNSSLPTYYTSLCLRMIPILDIVIHRMIELPPRHSRVWLIDILRSYSGLFAYHDTPISFLHNTLFYYDTILATQRDLEKRVLVRSCLEHLSCKPMEYLSAQFIKYLRSEDSQTWSPSPAYFSELVHRLDEVIKSSDMSEFSHIDWRFNEFGNPVCLILYLKAIELMCIPLPANKLSAEYLAEHRQNIGTKVVDIVLNNDSGQLPELCNTLGILLSALPISFSHAVYKKIVEILQDSSNFNEVEGNVGGILWNNKAQNVLILVHSFFQHCKTDKIGSLPDFITKHVHLFTTEAHVVYILKLVSPFLCHIFRFPPLNQTLRALYQVMFNLLSENSDLANPDLFVDYMYYIKYSYAGAEFKQLIEQHLPTLPADISSKLKFLVVGSESTT